MVQIAQRGNGVIGCRSSGRRRGGKAAVCIPQIDNQSSGRLRGTGNACIHHHQIRAAIPSQTSRNKIRRIRRVDHLGCAQRAIGLAQQHKNTRRTFPHRDVHKAVPIEVTDRQAGCSRRERIVLFRGECSVALVDQHRHF